MGFLAANISRIEQLVAEGTQQSLTYAALECRLAIEFFCYERLRVAREYVAHEDLIKWQPKDVVKTLISEVFEYTASDVILSISMTPSKEGKDYSTASDFEEHDYQEIGRQSSFDPNKIGKLWNSLSSFLHVRVPKSKNDPLPLYGDIDKLKSKIEDTLSELRLIDRGTMFMSGFGEEVNFDCSCGTLNKRRVNLLSHGKTISCVSGDCDEKYTVEIGGDEINFARQRIEIACKACGCLNITAAGPVMKMRYNQAGNIICECGEKISFRWGIHLMEKSTDAR